MQKILLEPHYLPGIRCFKEMLEAGEVIFFSGDVYRKQSFRNRCRILGSNGVLDLSIPVQHPANGKPFKEILVEKDSGWPRQHWTAIKSAYQRAPYFSHFAPGLEALICEPLPGLWENNIRLIEWLFRQAGQELHYSEVLSAKENSELLDRRGHWHPKTPRSWTWGSYPQVFDKKYGFQADLSILDFLFNMGS